MKKYIIALILIAGSVVSQGQQVRYNIAGVTNKTITTYVPTGITINSGETITILNYQADPTLGKILTIIYKESPWKISASDLNRITLNPPSTREELWETVRIKSDFNQSITSKGFQYDLRKELEDETVDAIQNFEKYYGFFDDEFLEDYIQSLLLKIHPITLNDGRPGSLSVRILKMSSPNSFCMPTGTIILTTGLLSTIRSEDELIGILAHETAHFVLDHHVVNINAAATRQKRAEFWAGLATVAAAASEIYLAEKYDYNFYGDLTRATAIVSTAIATSISERLGIKYSTEQESEADATAFMTLKLLNKDPKAFIAALTRIRDYSARIRDNFSLSAEGNYSSLSSRIIKLGEVDPTPFNDTRFVRVVSLVNTYNSMMEYGLQHFEETINLADRNIEARVATEDDYLMKALAIRSLFDTYEKNREVLDLITKAKSLNIVPNNYLNKQEGITLIRLGRLKEAQVAFETYLLNLSNEAGNDFIINEIDWTKKMINKVGLL